MTDYDHLPIPVGEASLKALWLKNQEPVSAVATMLPSWNQMCRDEGGGEGLAHGWHIGLAGRTGAGKSIIGLNVAAHAAKKGHKVGYLSLEMSRDQLVTRSLAIVSGVPVRYLEPGKTYNEDRFQEAAQLWVDQIDQMLYVNPLPITTLEQVERAIRVAHEEAGVRVFITDYLQLAWVAGAKSLVDQITEVSHTIRGLAQKLKVVSVGLSQFNRETSKSKDRPDVTGLMAGSSLENDSDQVVLLDHTTYKKVSERSAIQELLLAKNRHGPIGRIAVQWDYETLRITETDERLEDDGYPPF